MRSLIRSTPVALLLSGALSACGGVTGNSNEEDALLNVKVYVETNLDQLHQASSDLCAAAPAPDADGWNATSDAAAVETMRGHWKKARIAYEHVEGAIAVLFPDLDVSTDERYEGFIESEGDENLFDDQGVTGIHGIERILWSNQIPESVLTFEQGLPHYKAAAFPATQAEAEDFRNKLCARLVTDVASMRDQFKPLGLDTSAAFRGVIGSMQEQKEKANKAETGTEESRYAQHTLADMRANVEGGLATFEAFRPWLVEKGGEAEEQAILAGLNTIKAKYDAIPGESLPPVPTTWSATNPSAEDKASPFGQLFELLAVEADPDHEGSTVHEMNHAAELLGIPQLAE